MLDSFHYAGGEVEPLGRVQERADRPLRQRHQELLELDPEASQAPVRMCLGRLLETATARGRF